MESDFLHDRIRMLCAKAIMTPSSDIEPVIVELQEALREHVRMVRRLAAESLVSESSSKNTTI